MLLDIEKRNQMEIKQNIYFNMMGIIPYWLKGRKKRSKGESFSTTLNEKNSKIYNMASHSKRTISSTLTNICRSHG